MKHPKSYDSTPETRKRMSNVKLKGGKAETALAKELWRRGIRYRKNYKKLPGSPDIAITKHKIAVFVDGEFWHGYDWENKKEKLKANREYWIEKIEENIARDKRDSLKLEELGWVVIRFWEREVKKDIETCVKKIFDTIEL
ncbi:MAG: very short patch repair endonuclease [Lachnospiraceae bacterium]|nr:very short patch repair endonuclease [Lachnospiraceae bacterium]